MFVSTPTSIKNTENIRTALEASNAILIQGEIGCGKTLAVDYLSNLLGFKETLIQVDVDDSFDSKDLLGKFSATETPGTFQWIPGPLTIAVEKGYWVLMEDIDLASFDVFSVLLSLLENSTLFISDKNRFISAHPNFKLIATQQIVVSGDALFSKKNGIPHQELWATVIMSRIPATEQCEIVHQIYSSAPLPVLDALTSLSKDSSTSNIINLRTLLRWGKRVNRRLQTKTNTTDSLVFYSSTIREMFLKEAYDCFVARFAPGAEQQTVFKLISEACGIPLAVAETIVLENKPQHSVDLTECTFGRVSLPLKSLSRITRESRIAFAETRQAMLLLESLSAAVENGEHVLLTGETGVGKTFVVQYLADQLGQSLLVHNLNQQTDTSDFMGGWKPLDLGISMRALFNTFTELFAECFSVEKNTEFLNAVQNAFNCRNWERTIRLIQKGCSSFCQKYIKQGGYTNKTMDQWNELKTKADETLSVILQTSSNMAFFYEEGSLIKAWREGHWILLDELNLATTEVLERVSSVLGDVDRIFLTDKGSSEAIPRHKNFHVFANMNPPTDVGKKDLPPSLRSRFTEFYVSEPFNASDISTIVREYIGFLTPDAKIYEITDFFLDCVSNAKSKLCALDGESKPPSFSMRTLTRALSYVRKATPCYGFNVSLFDGLLLGFATPLQRHFHKVIESLIIKNIFRGKQPSSPKLPSPPSDGEYVSYQHIWIKAGLRTPFNDEKFILTNSVKGHLTNLSRAVFANRPVLLEGPTSSGKSSMVQYLAQLTGNTFVRINNHESTEVQEYLGHYVTDESGKLRFVDGILVNAVRNGYWVVLDELNLAPTDVLEALNRLLDDNCELFIPDTQETIKPHSSLRIFATQNPAGIYGGRKVLSRAFRNRFLEITVDDIPADEIVTILKRRYSMPEGFATKVVEIMTNLQVRRQNSQIFAGKHGFITPRDLFRWAERKPSTYQELAEHGFLLLGERCRKEEERQIIKDVIESVTKTVICEEELYKPSHWPFVNKYYNQIHEGTIDEFKIVWTASMQRLFTVVGICLEHLEPVLLVGETGSSKTTVCQLWSALMGVPLRILNFHQHSEAADFLGSLRPTPPDRRDVALFEWRDGPLVECMRLGYFFLLDEISLTEDSVLERLNSVLEPSRSITLAEKSNGESFVAHERFRVLATMNPGGDFGKKELSPALRNRFTEVYVRPTTEEGEVATIISKRLLPEIREKWSVKMARVLCCLTSVALPSSGGSPTHISIRDIISWVEFMNAVNGKCSEELAFAHGLDALLLDGIGVGSGQVEGAIDQLKKMCLRQIEKVLCDFLPHFVVPVPGATLDSRSESTNALPQPSSSSPSSFSLSSVSAPSLQKLVEEKPFWEVLEGMNEPTLPSHLQSRFFFGAPTTQRNLSKLMRSTVLCKAVLLEGSPGVGKTSIVEALGAALGVRVVRINLSEQTDVMDLFGTFLPQVVEEEGTEKKEETKNGRDENEEEEGHPKAVENEEAVGDAEEARGKISTKEKTKGPFFAWSDGVLLQALKEGSWAILDELNLASQSVLEGLNALLDHRAAVFIPELNQSFNAHPNFRIFACQNPLVEGGGRKGLPRSFLNRFVNVRMEAFTREDLMVITRAICPDIPLDVLSAMVDFIAELQRETMWKRSFGLRGSPWEFNLRDVLRWAGLLRRYQEISNPMAFADMLFLLRFRTDEDRVQCRAILDKYFSSRDRKKDDHHKDNVVHASSSSLLSPECTTVTSLSSQTPSIYSSDFLIVGNTIIYKGRALFECLDETNPSVVKFSSSSSSSKSIGVESQEIPSFASSPSVGPDTNNENADKNNLLCSSSFPSSRMDLPLLLLPSQGDIVATLLMCAAQSQFAILVGASGSGKTFALQTAAVLARAKIVTFSINASCDTVDLLGGFDQVEDKQGEFEWRDSLILEAMQQGHWLVLDNVNYCHASVLDRLNPLVEPNGVLYVNEQGLVQGKVRMIRPHPHFRLFATMNPRYGEISRAMRNRAVEICLSPVPLPSLEGLTLCATATPALSLRSSPSLRYTPSPLTLISFSFGVVLTHFADFHQQFVRQAFRANTLLPLSPNLSDANAAGSPNIFTLLRASSMLPLYFEKLMKKQEKTEKGEVEEEKDNEGTMSNILVNCLLEVLQHCYLDNRLGSWRHQKEELENVLHEKYVNHLRKKLNQWKGKRDSLLTSKEKEMSPTTFSQSSLVKKELEEGTTSTRMNPSTNGEAWNTQERDNEVAAEDWPSTMMALNEPRLEDAIRAFTLGTLSSFFGTSSTPPYSSGSSSSTCSSNSRLHALSRRLLQCRVWRSGMGLQKMIQQEVQAIEISFSSSSLSSQFLACHSLADVLAAFVLEQVTDGAVLEELSTLRKEFLREILLPLLTDRQRSDGNASMANMMGNAKEENTEENQKSEVHDTFSALVSSPPRLFHAVEPLLHPQYCLPSQLPRLLGVTRMAIGSHADILERAQKVEAEGLVVFIADSPSVNRAATRVVGSLLHALRSVVPYPSIFQSLLGCSVAFFHQVFPSSSSFPTTGITTTPTTATTTTRGAGHSMTVTPTVLTAHHFVPFISRALLLLEWEETPTLLPLASSSSYSAAWAPSFPLDGGLREGIRSSVLGLLEDVRQFLELPFPITDDVSLLHSLLPSVHVTSEEERKVLATYQGILQQKIVEEEEEQQQRTQVSRTVLRPLWWIAAFRTEFSLLQRLITLCHLSPVPSTLPHSLTNEKISSSSSSLAPYSPLMGASRLAMDISNFIVDFTQRMPLYTALDLSLWASVREALVPVGDTPGSTSKIGSKYSLPQSSSSELRMKKSEAGRNTNREEGKKKWIQPHDGRGVWEDVRRYVPLVVTQVFQRYRKLQDVYSLFFGSWSSAACRCLRFAREVPVLSIGLRKANPHAEALTSFFSFLSHCPKAPRDPLGGWRRNAEIELLQIISVCFPTTKAFCEELLQAHPNRKRAGSVIESVYKALPQMIQDLLREETRCSDSSGHPTSTSSSTTHTGTVPLPRPEWTLIQMLLNTLQEEGAPSLDRRIEPGNGGFSSSCFPLRAISLLCALKCRLLLPSSPIDQMYRRALQVNVAEKEMEDLSKLAHASVWASRVAHRQVEVGNDSLHAIDSLLLPQRNGPHRQHTSKHHGNTPNEGNTDDGSTTSMSAVVPFSLSSLSSSSLSATGIPHLELLKSLHEEEQERGYQAGKGLVARPDPSGGQYADLTRELHRLVHTFFSDDRLQQVLGISSSLTRRQRSIEEEEEGGENEEERDSRQRVENQRMAGYDASQEQVIHTWGELLFQETMTLLHHYGGYEDTTLHFAQASLFAAVTSYVTSCASSRSSTSHHAHQENSTSITSTTSPASTSKERGSSGVLLKDAATVLRQMQFPCELHSPVPLPIPPSTLSPSSPSLPLARRLHYLDACLTLLSAAIPPSLNPSFVAGLFASYRALYTHVEELNQKERQAEELTVKYKESSIFIEGDDEKMLKKLKSLFPSYEEEFSSLLKNRDDQEDEEDEVDKDNGDHHMKKKDDDHNSSSLGDTNQAKQRDEKERGDQISRSGNQVRILFAEKDGLYVRRLVEIFTLFYTRLLDGRLDQQQFSMDLYLESYKTRFDTLASELRDWSLQNTGESHGAMMAGIADDLVDREECLLMSGFAARAALVRKEFSNLISTVATKNAVGFNIFKDPDPSEVSQFSVPLGRLIKRLEELLREYPENVTLLHCLRVAQTVGQLKALQTPLMKVMTGCEVLLSQCYEWERNASTAVSLMPSLAELSCFILRWRRLELHSWGHIFKAKREEFELTAALKWFEFYDLVHMDTKMPNDAMPGSREGGDVEDEFTCCVVLFKQFSSYLWAASIGDFSARLRLIKGLAFELATRCGVTSPRTNVALHVVDFFCQFEAFVQEKCTTAVKPLEEEMNEFCQIMRWEDANYYAVRATVEKSHLKVARVLSSLEDILRTPMLPLLAAEEERCLEEPCMGFTLPPCPIEKKKKANNEEKGKGREKKTCTTNGSEAGTTPKGKKGISNGVKRSRNGKKVCSSTSAISGSSSISIIPLKNGGNAQPDGNLGEVGWRADTAVSRWPDVAKAVHFFHNGAEEVIMTVSSLQAPKVSQQLKIRSLKIMLDRLAWCGIPHTHEQQVEHWEVLYSSTEALLCCRTAFSHQLTGEGERSQDALVHSSFRSLTVDTVSKASQELYRFCRWVQRMREAERHPHSDLSGAQVKRGTGTVESLLAHLIHLSRWCFQLFELHDGLSTLMKLMKDGVVHRRVDRDSSTTLPSTSVSPNLSSLAMPGTGSQRMGQGLDFFLQGLPETLQAEGWKNKSKEEGERPSLASIELLNHSLQWVATLRSTTSSFHWLRKESLTVEVMGSEEKDALPNSMRTPSAVPALSSFSPFSASPLPRLGMMDEEEGSTSTTTVEYSTEDRTGLIELHHETEKLWEMCVDCEVVRRHSLVLPMPLAQRFFQQYERLLGVCCRLQHHHCDPVVRASAGVCARSLSKDINSWEERFCRLPKVDGSTLCDGVGASMKEQGTTPGQHSLDTSEEVARMQSHSMTQRVKKGEEREGEAGMPSRQRHCPEKKETSIKNTENSDARDSLNLSLSSEISSSLSSFLFQFSNLSHYCEALEKSSLMLPGVIMDDGEERSKVAGYTHGTSIPGVDSTTNSHDKKEEDGWRRQEQDSNSQEFHSPLLPPIDESEDGVEGKEEDDDEHNIYPAYVKQVNAMQTATENALEVVSSLLHTGASLEDCSTAPSSDSERVRRRRTMHWLEAMTAREGGGVYAQVQHARKIVEHAQCGVIETIQSHAFFGVVLSRLLAILLKKGFCKSSDEEQDGQGEGEQGGVQEGTGMDDGQGEKDVTNEMENEDQLMNEKDKQEKPEDEENKKNDGNDEEKEDNAADVETDFAGEKEQREESDEDDENEDEDDQSEQEMGEVGEEDEVQDRKRSRREKEDQEELNEDDGDAADDVPLDEFEEHGDNEDEETGGFENKQDEIRDKEQEEEEENKNKEDREIVGDDEKEEREQKDGIEDEEMDDNTEESREENGSSRDGSQEREGEEEDEELSIDKDKEAEDDHDGNEEGREGEDGDTDEDQSSMEEEEAEFEREEKDGPSDVESMEDGADQNVYDGGQQDDLVGEEATENKEDHKDRSKEEKRKRNDTAGTEDQQELNEDEEDDSGRNWKKKQEENASTQRKDNTQDQQRSEQSNPYKALKEALQRHQRQSPQQLNLHKEVKVQNKEESENDHPKRKPPRHQEEDNQKEENVDHFEFDEEGEEEGMAATEEFAPPTVEKDEESEGNWTDSEEDKAMKEKEEEEDDPEDHQKKRKNPSEVADLSMEEEENQKEKHRRQKKASKKEKGEATAQLHLEEEENDEEQGEEGEEEKKTRIDEKLEKGRQRWLEHEASVQGLSQQLCEQLRLILTPTLADKLQGDYKTGKRLNMKRIIPYIASQFKKDRIWLRRTKPNKRTYQILVALDDSLSMKCNDAGEFCCRAVTLMAKALQQLESGEVAIARFGEETQLLHPLEEPFTLESGPRVFSEITFAQNSTKLGRFLEYTLSYLDTARERLYGQTRSTSQELLQLLYIFSDGQITENRSDIHKLMIRAEENHQMVVFVILDIKAAEGGEREGDDMNPTKRMAGGAAVRQAKTCTSQKVAPLTPDDLKGLSAAERLRRLKADREKRLQRVQSKSILDMQLVEFKGGEVVRKGYMEDFPFPYYLIVREMERLPEIIADSMRQWFELLNGH